MPDRTRQDLARHAKVADAAKLRVAISGASGLIGTQLGAFLQTGGHSVTPLLRKRPSDPSDGVYWNPETGDVDIQAMEGVDAVIHLAGENVAGGRWTEERKRAVLDSRVRGTKTVVDAMLKMSRRPRVLVTASAIGYYGGRGEEPLQEDSPAGAGFLADVCKAWEDATRPAAYAGIRVVNVRIGIVLAAQGGALGTMLTPFKLGMGGVVGSGRQFMSWVSLDDVVGLFHHALLNEGVSGPLNGTAPSPVTNAEFTKTLGRVLRRPTMVPLPSFAVRAMFGEMGDSLLLQGSRVLPKKAESTGFEFLHRDLESALRAELGR